MPTKLVYNLHSLLKLISSLPHSIILEYTYDAVTDVAGTYYNSYFCQQHIYFFSIHIYHLFSKASQVLNSHIKLSILNGFWIKIAFSRKDLSMILFKFFSSSFWFLQSMITVLYMLSLKNLSDSEMVLAVSININPYVSSISL